MKVREIADLMDMEQGLAIYVKGEVNGFKGKVGDMPWRYVNCEVKKIGSIAGGDDGMVALEVEKWGSTME